MLDLPPSPLLVLILLILVLSLAWSMFRSVPQATVGVVTVFGKYRRIMREGLNIKLPWEKVVYRLSLQNRALQLEFQAITQDQANVKFATMVLYAVAASEEEAIKKAVFSFAGPTVLCLNRMDLPCSRCFLWLHAGGTNPGSISGRSL